MQGVEELDGRKEVREDHIRRIHKESTHEASEAISKELGANEGEDANGNVWRDVVVQRVGLSEPAWKWE